MVIETDRLILREWTIDDAEAIFGLNADPDVLRYTGDIPFESVEQAKLLIETYDQYKKNGFGRWGVILKETDEFIGWSGLKRIKEDGLEEVDLGYRFFKEHWDKGYATESGFASLKVGFEKYNLDQIVGRTVHQNLGSVRVLEKLGMTYWKDVECEAHPARCFKITREEFLGA